MLDNLLNALGCVKVSIWLTPWWLQSNNTKWKSSIKCYQSRRWQNNLSKEVQTKISFFGLFFHFSKSCLLTWDASGNIAQACSDSPRIPAGTCFIKILQKMKHFLKPTELCQQSQSHLNQPHRSWRAWRNLEPLVPTPIDHCNHNSSQPSIRSSISPPSPWHLWGAGTSHVLGSSHVGLQAKDRHPGVFCNTPILIEKKQLKSFSNQK